MIIDAVLNLSLGRGNRNSHRVRSSCSSRLACRSVGAFLRQTPMLSTKAKEIIFCRYVCGEWNEREREIAKHTKRLKL